MTPRVSVVMPARNAQTYVGEAVRSVLGQTLRDLELVVVDDGSTDSTAEIVDGLAAFDERVRLYAGRGDGVVAALNEGCALATAPLLARMDADDVAEPMRLARQLEAMDAEPDLVLLGTAVTQIDERGTAFATVSYPVAPGKELLERNCFAHPTVVFRREVFEQLGGYRNLFPHAEDYDLWLRFAEIGRLANLPEPLLRYRIHPAQVTRTQIASQAASTLATQAAARIHCARAGEQTLVQFQPRKRAVRRRVFAATVELAATQLDAGRVEEAASLLKDAGRLLLDASRISGRAYLVQVARLRRRQVAAYARRKRKSPQP